MTTVTISPKFQIVIPKEVRVDLDLHPGEKLQIFSYNNRIEYIPLKKIKKLRGLLKGINTEIIREHDRI